MIVAPHLYGGVFPWAAVLIAAMCLAALVVGLLARDRVRPDVTDWLLGVMVIAWAWTCLQALALPTSLARSLRLQSLQNALRLEPVIGHVIPATVSVDPGATELQAVIGVAIVSAFVSARLLERRHPGTVARAAVVSVALIGLSGLVHEILGADAVYGSYVPRFTNSRLLSPIMNNNHMSGFLMMGALVAIGLAVDGRDRRTRALWLCVAAFCALLVPWVLSRGAIGALVFGIGFWIWALRRRDVARGRRGSASALAVAAIIGAAIFFALEPLLRRFEQQDFSKLRMALEGLRLLDGPAWWLGVGRGAFSSAFAAMEGSRLRITHPENILVQWSTEWGMPVAALLVLVVLAALGRRFRSLQTASSLGLFVGLVALTLQNLVDFSLEIPAIAVVASASLGALMAPKLNGASSDARPAKGILLVLGAALLSVFVFLAPRVVGSDTQSQADRLTRAMQAGDDGAFQQTLTKALEQHPTEPIFPLLAGAHAMRRGDPKVLRWLSIAMIEAPGWGSPHVLAAEWLERTGRPDQALLELREAERRTPGAGLRLLCEILPKRGDLEVLERAAPDPADPSFYDRAMRCGGLDETFREATDARILSLEPTHPLAAAREARRLTARDQSAQGIGLLEGALAVHPKNVRLWEALAATHLAAGSPAHALSVLDQAVERGIDADQVLTTRARIFAALRDREAMLATLSRLRGLAGGDPKKLAASYVLQGDLEASVQDVDRALEAYHAADRTDRSSLGLYKAAMLAAREGLRVQAYQAYRELCARSGGAACQRRDQLARQLGTERSSQ
jgi:hypothetical protein